MNSPTPVQNARASNPPTKEAKIPLVFSPAVALVLAMWLYMVLALVLLPVNSLYAHGLAIAASLTAGIPLEWLRSRGNKEYAIVFLILLTIAPLLYRYQHG